MTSARPLEKGDHLYLIDGSGYLFRAYHALPPLSRKSDGLPTGAVSGYCNMLWKLLEDMKDGDRPTHLAVIFDAGKKTFRNEIYPEYKANRPEPPEDLIPQFPLVRDATRAFGVACVEEPGFEADDLIATYARLAREVGARVTIVSSDKDLMQLVEDGKIQLLDTMKNKKIGSAEVIERFGVPPSKVVQVQALAGDSSDNVPGVPGIGVKTAAELINAYGDLETLLGRAGEIKQPKRRETLLENADKARLSYRLVLLDDHAKLRQTPEVFGVREPNPAALLAFLQAMEFASLSKRATAHYGIEDTDALIPPAAAIRPAGTSEESKLLPSPAPPSGGGAVAAASNHAAILKPIDYSAYETVTTLERLDRWIARARETGTVSVDTETTSLDAMQAGLCGVSLALGPNDACYIPCGHVAGEGLSFDAGEKIAQLKEDESVLKIG